MSERSNVWRSIRGLMVVVSLLVSFAGAWPAGAVEPDEILPDPKLEARARALSIDLRCLVCQNQSIDDSNAPLARDLRLLVRERLKAGDSDAAVMSYVVARYGDFVLLRPPLKWNTLILWLAAPLLLLAVGAMLWRSTTGAAPGGGAARVAGPALSREEEERLARLLDERGREPDVPAESPPQGKG